MCGRHRLSRRKQILAEHFDVTPFDDDWEARYNIAPTQPVPVIRQHPKEPTRVLSLMRWGLVPSSAKDMSVSAGMINARSETADQAGIPTSDEISEMFDSSGPLLRRRAVRIRGLVGRVEGPERTLDEVVLKLAFLERNRRLIRRTAEERIADRIAA